MSGVIPEPDRRDPLPCGGSAPVPVPSALSDLFIPIPVEALRVRELQALEIFLPLAPADLAAIYAAGEPRSLKAGEKLESPRRTISLLLEGMVQCSIRDMSDKPFPLGVEERGALYGEMTLLTNTPNDRKVELHAQTDIRVLDVPAELLLDLIHSNHSSSRAFSTLLARRLANMNTLAANAVDMRTDPSKITGRTLGERASDFLTAKIGSWQCIIGGSAAIGVHCGMNTLGKWWGINPYDPSPFLGLNTIVSLLSFYTIPTLLMSQNRQIELDRALAQATRRLLVRLLNQGKAILSAVGGMGRQLRGVRRELRQIRGELEKSNRLRLEELRRAADHPVSEQGLPDLPPE